MIQSGDTAFILVCAALVLLMTPGLALFYGGMVRSKNVLGTIMQSIIMISLISLEWIYLGYSMSFGPDVSGFIGDMSYFALSGVTAAPSDTYATTVPHIVFMIYQCMFAVITPALITGAFAERVRFAPFCAFSVLWAVLVYNPVCHWIWGGGFLGAMGVLDFAGGLVVHLTCGVAALVACLVIGPRKGFPKRQFIPHNLPMTLIGTGLLWFGWFGFNGGSALAADEIAATAFVATHIAGMTGMLTWTLVEWYHAGKPTTPGRGLGSHRRAGHHHARRRVRGPQLRRGHRLPGRPRLLPRGHGQKPLRLRRLPGCGRHPRRGWPGRHHRARPVRFHRREPRRRGRPLLRATPGFLATQLKGIAVVGLYTLAVSFVIIKAVNAVSPLRMAENAEEIGMDTSEHSESAYQA